MSRQGELVVANIFVKKRSISYSQQPSSESLREEKKTIVPRPSSQDRSNMLVMLVYASFKPSYLVNRVRTCKWSADEYTRVKCRGLLFWKTEGMSQGTVNDNGAADKQGVKTGGFNDGEGRK